MFCFCLLCFGFVGLCVVGLRGVLPVDVGWFITFRGDELLWWLV